MTAVFAETDCQTEPLTEKAKTFAVPVKFRNVKLIYLSMAPREDKHRYVKFEDLQGFFTPEFYTSDLSKKLATVYVVEFDNGVEPMVLPTDKFALNAITERDEI